MGNKNLTSTSTPNPAVQPYYSQLLQNTANLAQTPYTPFTGQGVAPVNQQQQQGIGNINQYAQAGLPYLGAAGNLVSGSANPLTAQQIQQYYNPYQQQVVGATEAQFNNQNAIQQQQVLGNAAAQGALGGNRTGIAQATLAGQQQLSEAPVIAGLESQGYQQALGTAAQQYQQNPQAAAYALGNIGQGYENAALTGANAQVGAGTLEQQTQQAGDVFNYQQYLNQLAYPFQTNQYAAGIEGGIGSLEGGQTTTPGPSILGQASGLGLSAAGILGGTGAFGAAGWLAPALAGLKRGGTVPERDETLHAQQKDLISGRRLAQMFPRGTKELPLPSGMKRTVAPHGVFHFDPGRITAEHIKHASSQDRENDVLGLGPYSKKDVAANGGIPVALVERKPDGTEVRAAAGSLHTAPHQIAEMAKTMHPDHAIHIEHIAHTLNERKRAAGGPVGLDTGGTPYGGGGMFGGVGSTPYGGGTGYIPGLGNMPHGSGPPQALNAGQMMQQANQGPQQMMQQAGALAKMFGAKSPAAGSQAINDTAALNANGQFTSGPGINTGYAEYDNGSPVGIMGVAPFADSAARGGAMRYGGLVLPTKNRIELKRGGPIRAGMGLSSFMPRRFADGGTPDFDQEFADVNAGPPAAPLNDVPLPQARPDSMTPLPAEITQGVSAPRGIRNNNPLNIEAGDFTASQPGFTGVEPQGRFATFATPDAGINAATNLLDSYGRKGLNTIDSIVSRWAPASDNNNPGAYAAFVAQRLGVDPSQPLDMSNTNVRMALASAMGQYENGQALGFSGSAPSGGTPGVGGGQQTAQDILNLPDQQYVKPVPPPSHEYSRADIGQSLLAAGLGMMASGSHFPLQAIGQGGLQGVAQLGALRKQEQEEYKEAQNVNESVARLNQQANYQRKDLALKAAQADRQEQHERFQEMQPKQIGMGPMGPIYGVVDPANGGFRILDPESGKPGALIGQPGGQLGPQSMAPPTPQSGTPQAQPAVLQATDPAKFAPPDIVKTQFGNDDAAAGLRNVYATDQNPTAGLNPQALKALSEDPFAQQNPGIAARAIAIAQGRAPILPTTGRSAYLNQYLDNKAYELNPMLDGTTFQRRQRTENFYAVGTQGGGGQNIVALNRWLAHSGSLLGLAEKMNMGDYTTLNQAKIELAKRGLWTPQLQDQLGAWDVNATGVAGEAAKVFTGSNPALADREGWEKILTPDTPLHTIRAKLQQAADMGEQALNANVANYNEGMRTNHNPREFMTQRSQQILDALKEGKPISSLGGGASKEVDPRDAAALKDNAKNPAAAAAIDRKYGAGTAARLLGTQ